MWTSPWILVAQTWATHKTDIFQQKYIKTTTKALQNQKNHIGAEKGTFAVRLVRTDFARWLSLLVWLKVGVCDKLVMLIQLLYLRPSQSQGQKFWAVPPYCGESPMSLAPSPSHHFYWGVCLLSQVMVGLWPWVSHIESDCIPEYPNETTSAFAF